MKYCTKCKQELDESQYGKNKLYTDGLAQHCKKCHAARMRAAYWKDPVKQRARSYKYWSEHNKKQTIS